MNPLTRHRRRWLEMLLLLASLNVCAAPAASQRERLSLDFDWKFHLGDDWGAAHNLGKAGTGSGPASMSFVDAGWRSVNLPHDWAVELPFDKNADGAHGFKAVGRGFAANSVGWYRRVFELPKEDAGKRLWLEFDGVFRDCTVFVNGWCVTHQESGYSSFRCDITDIANCGGRNVVTVKVDASQFEGWFYEGAGIYRHVWLVKTAPVAIAPDGVFVFSKFKNNVPKGAAEIHIATHVNNSQAKPVHVLVKYAIIDPDGKPAGEGKSRANLESRSGGDVEAVISVGRSSHGPVLWSPESPILYQLITTVEVDGAAVDGTETEFGIRTVGFDATNGFMLNGAHYELKGTCNHQDHAGVGSALPDRLQYFRIARLKEMGCNAYRTSHNPPTPELLEACDRLGMLVMDENRLLGSDTQNLDKMERLVRRDRNHASVAIWSICNEESAVQAKPSGAMVAATMQQLVKRLDPTRPVTCAVNLGNVFNGIDSVIEVRGGNYFVGAPMEDYHRAHPAQPEVGTEQASTVSTRGIYANDKQRGYVSAYDDNAPRWGHTSERWWSFFAERPWLSGGFVWTGFDYRGEPTPYWWPCVNSHFGILDTCGFPKDNFWYYQSWWTEQPVLHLLPHWNWAGEEGREMDVRALSNCEEVELFLNGQSLGRQTMKKNSHLAWKVKYAPGTLSAKGYKGGQVVAETKVETTGALARVQLTADRVGIDADEQDVSVITVAVTDERGRIVPVASNHVTFTLTGPGKIIGVGNGDPSCHEPDVFLPQSAMSSRPVSDWRWKRMAQVRSAQLPELGAQFDDSGWDQADVQAAEGPLSENENGIFRAPLVVTEEELACPALELHFSRIDEDGWIYVNGHRVGESHDWQDAPNFNIKDQLHAGTNQIAVAVENKTGPGGLNLGVSLQMAHSKKPMPWQRSVFNGLAQIIVQSSGEAGEIQLTGEAEGLAPGTIKIEAEPCVLKPRVEGVNLTAAK